MDLLGDYGTDSSSDGETIPTAHAQPLPKAKPKNVGNKQKRILQLSKVLPPEVYAKLVQRADDGDSDSDSDSSPTPNKLAPKANTNTIDKDRAGLNSLLSSLKQGSVSAKSTTPNSSTFSRGGAGRGASKSGGGLGNSLTSVTTTKTTMKKKSPIIENIHGVVDNDSSDSDDDTPSYISEARNVQQQMHYQNRAAAPALAPTPPETETVASSENENENENDERMQQQKNYWLQQQQQYAQLEQQQQQQQQQHQPQPTLNNKRKRGGGGHDRDMERALLQGNTDALNQNLQSSNTAFSAPVADFNYTDYADNDVPPESNESATSIPVYDPKTGTMIQSKMVTATNSRKGQISKVSERSERATVSNYEL